MMPQDLTPGADEIGAPALCAHHRVAIHAMASHGHVDAEATTKAAADIARQCCAWRPDTKETP